MEPEPTLSVVVIARNEAERIRGCVESVLALDAVEGSEVVLVDSNSTDGTVDIATEYPITVLRIPSDDLSTPGAGRQVGFRHVRGDLVLFVDGDVHLVDGWLGDAVRTVAENPDVAGVDGHLEDDNGEGPVDHLHGVVLYDADALDRVGGFDPGLDAMEDIELGYRLRRAGYRLVRLPVVVGSHPRSSGYGEIRRRWASGYLFGIGQGLRKSLADPGMVANWLSRYWFPTASGLWLTVGGLLAALHRGPFRTVWVTLSAAAFAFALATRGWRWTLHKTLSDLATPPGIAVGFGRYDRDSGAFPYDRVEVVTTQRPSLA